jgi:hypothetical protein
MVGAVLGVMWIDCMQLLLLFSGWCLQHVGLQSDFCDKAGRIRTPDGGCLAVVLRTGAWIWAGLCD